MRDPERINRILAKIRKLWAMNYDQRLGQLLLNASREYPAWPDIFYLEDDELEELLDGYFNVMQRLLFEQSDELRAEIAKRCET